MGLPIRAVPAVKGCHARCGSRHQYPVNRAGQNARRLPDTDARRSADLRQSDLDHAPPADRCHRTFVMAAGNTGFSVAGEVVEGHVSKCFGTQRTAGAPLDYRRLTTSSDLIGHPAFPTLPVISAVLAPSCLAGQEGAHPRWRSVTWLDALVATCRALAVSGSRPALAVSRARRRSSERQCQSLLMSACRTGPSAPPSSGSGHPR